MRKNEATWRNHAGSLASGCVSPMRPCTRTTSGVLSWILWPLAIPPKQAQRHNEVASKKVAASTMMNARSNIVAIKTVLGLRLLYSRPQYVIFRRRGSAQCARHDRGR